MSIFFQTYFCLSLAVSYNQPKFCPNAVWQSNASTFANSSRIGSNPFGIFINTYDTVHVTNQGNGQIFVWSNSSYNQLTILNNFNFTYSLFVTADTNIYVNGGRYGGNITKWIWNTNTSVFVMNVQGVCCGIFVDINDFLYCSVSSIHTIIKKSLNSNTTTIQTVAGTGCAGLSPSMLYKPQGIFVHTDLSLYVADCGNDRIQLFQYGTLNGTTIAGNGAPNTITLDCPTAIVLDDDAYIYIVDQNNNRIIGSGSNGYQCLVGCSGSGSASDQLNAPQSMAFDSYGNMFVIDRNNGRIQKFFLETHLCGKS
jgi:hypothetical protein